MLLPHKKMKFSFTIIFNSALNLKYFFSYSFEVGILILAFIWHHGVGRKKLLNG